MITLNTLCKLITKAAGTTLKSRRFDGMPLNCILVEVPQ